MPKAPAKPLLDAPRRAAQIALLNDNLRRYRLTGRLAVTAGVMALGEDALPAILELVATFNTFNGDNDPYGEHDFDSLNYDDARIFWKIDYYDLNMEGGSLGRVDKG